MNENMKKRNEVLAQTVIKGLESRNMTGYYAADKGEALKPEFRYLSNATVPKGAY